VISFAKVISFASSEKLRPCHTLSRMATSRSSSVASSATPMKSTGPCQAAGVQAAMVSTNRAG